MNMYKGPISKTYQRYRLTQIRRVGMVAIYQVDDGSHYEVVKIRVENVSKMGSVGAKFALNGYTHMEVYPKSELWGKRGFTYTSLREAEDKFNMLIKTPGNGNVKTN